MFLMSRLTEPASFGHKMAITNAQLTTNINTTKKISIPKN